MNSEIVQNLLQGQRNIDRMRNEVETVVSMMVGFAMKVLGYSWWTEMREFESKTHVWNIQGEYRDRKMHLYVSCKEKLIISGAGVAGFLGVYEHKQNEQMFGVERVQGVFESLPEFVQGMLETFPFIQQLDEWKALHDAVDVYK